MPRFSVLSLLALLLLVMSCQKDYAGHTEIKENLRDSDLFAQCVENLTDIQVHDIFAPPVAARIYAYPCIAAYEALQPVYSTYPSLAGKIAELEPYKTSVDTALVSAELAAIYAFNQVGQALIFSEEKMDVWEEQVDSLVGTWQVNPEMVKASKTYADGVSQHILAWANTDNYNQTRTMPKFSVTDDPHRWKPTPPAYLEGIEPHWNKIRPFVLDSAAQFQPAPPPAFDLAEGSTFYNLVKEVYDVGNDLTEEERLIASFWDCNPFVMNQTGHVMFATKKITPGGHWMGITSIVCRKAQTDLMASVKAHTMVSIGLFDAFISCWDEKYRSNLIRPETVINETMDPDWLPTLQTPPFPEHTSGHSVISTASATILTELFGENFAFTDDVEVKYGLPERSFDSFLKASQEAAISRLYGGIHYRPAIEDGVTQGRQVGEFITDKLLVEPYEGITER
ncbi:MAG: vanadium-dependent haloperoxidase [Bacteroidota bacterium]